MTISTLSKIAKFRGGECLGLSHIKQKHRKHVWKCNKGHTWEARVDSVIRGSWCPKCRQIEQENKIVDMRILAKQKGGECLSTIYIDHRTRLKWKCNKGHIFEATPTKVKMGRWCRKCGNQVAARKRRIPLQEIQMIAIARKGKCLSEEYNPKEKLKWQCEFGHIWFASAHSVKKGSWCPVCGHKRSGRKRLTLEEMHQFAASQGGKCLSENYINSDTKLKWMCKNGHVWTALPLSVKKGHWCAECAGQKMLTLRHMEGMAKERGGKCLSSDYHGVNRKLQWQCAEGHTWSATYSNLRIGRWCPECSSGVGERICRANFEQLFRKNFPKTRPPWLINQDGFQMELDGYCEELNLAFEHQGRQHYESIDHFYSSREQFQKRQVDDRKKKSLCKKHNIILIEIPQIPDYLHISKVQSYIIKRCGKIGVEIPVDAENIRVKLLKAYTPTAIEKMKQVCEAAENHGGICLSTTHAGNQVKLRFRCENGHEWETVPDVVINGHWCPKCSASKRGFARRLTIEEMQSLAEKHGGRCLSQTYVNANEHLLWECSKGHQWKAIPNSIKRGSWCSLCSNEKKGKKKRIKQAAKLEY